MEMTSSRGAKGGAALPIQGLLDARDLATILDRVPFGSVIVDARGVISFLSRPYARFLGIRREEAIGRHVSDMIENSRMHVVVQKGEVEIGRQRVHGQDLVVQRIPIRDESGQVVGAFGQVMFEVHELRDLVRRLNILESKVEYYSHAPRASGGHPGHRRPRPAPPDAGHGARRGDDHPVGDGAPGHP
jgi:PAS domain S-box-containing protein